MAKHKLVPNLPKTLLRTPPKFTCSGCAVGKMSAAPFRRHPRTDPVGSHLHIDICGPMPIKSLNNNLYFITLLDQGSRFLTIKCAPTKSSAAAYIRQHIESVHHTTPYRIRNLTSDNAREFHSHELTEFYKTNHIDTHRTVPHTPQENALAERINRTIMNTARANLLSSGLPLDLWDYATLAATDTYNHTPQHSTQQLPATMWHDFTPNIHTILPFGTAGYTHDPSPHNKLQPRSYLSHYIGRCDYRHYFVYNPKSQTVSRCRAVDFHPYNPLADPTRTVTTALTASSAPFTEPKSLKEARHSPDALDWQQAWNHELDTLERRGTLTFIHNSKLPPHTKLLPVTTVLKLKRDKHGHPTTRKVRCTVRGDRQVPGLHYDPTDLSSPVASRDTVRSALALAAANNYSTLQWDLESAFLHECFTEERQIYLQQPRRFDGSVKYPNHAALLTGNMYGCKQACKIFTEDLSQFLLSLHFQRIPSDPCSFLYRDPDKNSHFIFLVITVDDFLVITNNIPLATRTRISLSKKYKVKDLGTVQHIIGWKVDHSTTGISISQPGYIASVLERFRMTDAKTFTSPIASELLTPSSPPPKPLDTSRFDYKSLIGSLRYLADSTRPDISFIVGLLGRSAHHPTTHDWTAALRVLRYLKLTINSGITYSRKLTTGLTAYSDSDFAACPLTRRSTSGCILFYNDSPIAWLSRRQRNVSSSTFAAEYIAAFHATQLIETISDLLTHTAHHDGKPVPLFIDNAAALKTATAKYPTPKSRHVDVKYHWIREKVNQGLISPRHVPSDKNAADLLTKALKPTQFTTKLQLLRLTAPPARGD